MSKELVDFQIVPLNKFEPYYGFELYEDPLHLMPDGTVFHNSGKSVLEQSIVGHVSRYADRYQLVGVDCKRVEFNLLRGVKGVKGVALDVATAAATAAEFQHQMMNRFRFMEEQQVNNIYKIKDKEVNYYEWAGQKYQFDEMFELQVDLDLNERNIDKLKMTYPKDELYGLGTHRQPLIISIQDIYNGMMEGKWDTRHPQMPVVKGVNSFIDVNCIRKTKGMFTPKILLLLCDELNELMTSEDYKSVDTVKNALGSIARLGRAAAVHLALACQRASGSTISTDLKNNIQMCCLLGGFDDGASTLMFEKDISNQAKPQIKGRGFIGSGNEIIETQTYFTQPEKDWEFDTNAFLTFDNPEFKKQCKLRNINIDELNTGWVKQVPLDQLEKEDEDEEDKDEKDFEEEDEIVTKKSNKKNDDDFEFEDDDDDIIFPLKKKNTPDKKEEELEDDDDDWGWDEEDITDADIRPDFPKVNFGDKPEVKEDTSKDEISEEAFKHLIGETPNRDRFNAVLANADTGSKPKIKLNLDPTKAPNKPKIKLNIKNQNPDKK